MKMPAPCSGLTTVLLPRFPCERAAKLAESLNTTFFWLSTVVGSTCAFLLCEARPKEAAGGRVRVPEEASAL